MAGHHDVGETLVYVMEEQGAELEMRSQRREANMVDEFERLLRGIQPEVKLIGSNDRIRLTGSSVKSEI